MNSSNEKEIPNNNTDEDILEYDLNSSLQSDNIKADYRNSNYKFLRFYFEEISNSILLKQDWKLGKGGIFWDGSIVLAKIMYEKILKECTKSLNILELGAGTALPSIFAAKLGHSVVITDIKANIGFIKDNLLLNNLNENEKVKVRALLWESDDDIKCVKEASPVIDVIIGSEVVYWEEYFEDLIKVLTNLSNPKTIVILTFKLRHLEVAEDFFKTFGQYFTYCYVEEDLLMKHYLLKYNMKIAIARMK